MKHDPLHELMFDIGRTLGEHRLSREGDTRDDWQDALVWAAGFEAAFLANPDASNTYYEDIETYTLAMAGAAGFVVHKEAT